MFRRRRPLLGAAMIGGAAYAGHRAGQNQAYEQQQESDQEARLEALEAQQAPAAPAAAAAPAANSLAGQIQQLAQLQAQGVLSPEEFASAKAKLLAG